MRNSKFLVDYMYFRNGSISNICSHTKVKPHFEYDACMTIHAKFCSYPLNYLVKLCKTN